VKNANLHKASRLTIASDQLIDEIHRHKTPSIATQ
jgi:hypothetical protein